MTFHMRALQKATIPIPLKWTGWSLLLNLLWEFAQLPFYSFAPDLSRMRVLWYVLHCTAGDVGIALGSYSVAALATRRLSWPVEKPLLGLALALSFGLAWTVQSEWFNVYVRERWAYSASMPVVAGIGLLPLLQWLLLPPLAFLLVRRSETARSVASGKVRGDPGTSHRH